MKNTWYLFLLLTLVSCNSSKIPKKKIPQLNFPVPKIEVRDKALTIQLTNPVHCPIRVVFESYDSTLQKDFNNICPINLPPNSDTLIVVNNNYKQKTLPPIKYRWYFGSLSKKIVRKKIELPFTKGKSYKIIQGNNTNLTHNTDYSRYAIDFNLKTKDTICSATNGFVVGVIDSYKYGGIGIQWRKYGNFITIYESETGLFTQYVHLVKKGSLVKVGDAVHAGQPIGLSGNTGQSTTEHLHFNCLVPVDNNDGLISIPVEFVGDIKSIELNKGDTVVK